MCGIVGFSGGYGEELLTRMNRTIAHRGPDAAGLWFDPDHGVGLVPWIRDFLETSRGGICGERPLREARDFREDVIGTL